MPATNSRKLKPALRIHRTRPVAFGISPQPKKPSVEAPPLRYIDLFAGCGGLSTGLHLAGWHGLFAIERNAAAFSTLKANLIDKRQHFHWPKWLTTTNWDITALLARKRNSLAKLKGNVDLVVGGPPCQGFSTAGRRREGDERNKMVHSYLQLIGQVQPRAIFFENVRGFTMQFKADDKAVAAEEKAGIAYSEMVLRKLHELGYGDAWGELVDMSEYGVPQRRQRFIIIATRTGCAQDIFRTLKESSPRHLVAKRIPKKNRVKSALSDLLRAHGEADCPDSTGFQSGIASRATTGLQRLLRTNHHVYKPDSHRFVNHSKDVEAVFSKLLTDAPRNKCITGADRTSLGVKKRSVTVLASNQTAPTVTTLPDDLVHYSEPRIMTVRECARLQTFPDWFEFKGPYTTGGKLRAKETPRYTQVGNAVPPLFAEMVGLALKEVLQNVERPI